MTADSAQCCRITKLNSPTVKACCLLSVNEVCYMLFCYSQFFVSHVCFYSGDFSSHSHIHLPVLATADVNFPIVAPPGVSVFCLLLQLWVILPIHWHPSVFLGFPRYRLLSVGPFIERWWRSIVVRTPVTAGELSLFCARLMAGRVTTLWVRRPQSVNQHGQLSLPSLRGRLNE